MKADARSMAGRAILIPCLLWPLLAATAVGQDSNTLRELRRLHEQLCDSQRIIPAQEAEAALAQLRQWNLSPDSLNKEDGAALLATELRAAVAVGDAAAASEKLKELERLAPGTPETLETAYLVAAMTGNAEAAEAALKQLPKEADTNNDYSSAKRRRWMRHVGAAAPKVQITTDDGKRISVGDGGGIVLVIDFWDSRDTTPEYAKALKELQNTYRSELYVQFLGVNTDGEAASDDAHKFAREAGYAWPQHYEKESRRAPITYETFKAGSPPWTIVIDGAGRVRAVGVVTDPAFCYALRTAVREASRQFATDDAGGDKDEQKPPTVSKNDLPSNDEADALLRQARTYLRTKMNTKAKEILQEIIRKYPGTRQARDAEERLRLLP